jgi:hypothetical protein
MPFPQKDLPILLDLQGGGFFSSPLNFPLPLLFGSPAGIIRPENLTLTRPNRGTVIHSAENAWLDDFGRGVPILTFSGHTGWQEPSVALASIVAFKLFEALLVEYEERRKRTAAAGGDPDTVKLLYFDALNAQAFVLYPIEFTLNRTKSHPLLYFYQARFYVLFDLIYDSLYGYLPTDFLDFTGLGPMAKNILELAKNFGGFLGGIL